MDVVCHLMAMETQGARWAVAGAGRLECVPYLCTGTISLWAGLVGANLLLQRYISTLKIYIQTTPRWFQLDSLVVLLNLPR